MKTVTHRFRDALPLLLIAILTGCAVDRSAGHLLIIGGGLQGDNAAVYEKFAELAGPDADICVLPTASGVPQRSGPGTAEDLHRYCPGARISVIDLTVANPHRARDRQLARRIASADALWFTGGDQSRITQVFRPNGEDTPAHRAVRKVLAKGGVVAGTSAGAAMMSDPMIRGGRSEDALTVGVAADDDAPGVKVGRGMDLFPYGVTGQHFLQRGRLGRLIVALASVSRGAAHSVDRHGQPLLGFGVNENRAVWVSLSQDRIEALGNGAVVIVDVRELRHSDDNWGNIRVSLLSDGDVVDGRTGAIEPSPGRREVGGNLNESAPLCLDAHPWESGTLEKMFAALGAGAGSVIAEDERFRVTLSADARSKVLAGGNSQRTRPDVPETAFTVVDARLDVEYSPLRCDPHGEAGRPE